MKSTEISRLEENRGRNFCIGLIASMSFVLAAFNYTTYEDPFYLIEEEPAFVEDTVEIRRTPKTKKKELPPPPKMEVTEKFDIKEEIEFIEEKFPELENELLDEKVVEKEEVEYIPKPTPIPQPKPIPPALPPPEPVVDETEYRMVEYMPRFPGCEEMGLMKKEKEACAKKSMLAFIYANIKYPEMAHHNGIEGTVVLQFVVGKDGGVNDLKIVKEIGGGCGKEAARVLRLMPNWIPGIQQGNKVKVLYTIPVKYKMK